MCISGLETEPVIIRAGDTYQPYAVRTRTATDDTLAVIRSVGMAHDHRHAFEEWEHHMNRLTIYFVPMGVVPSLSTCTGRSILTSKELDRQCSFVP